MKTENKGIDYGLGKTNKHSQTGIRFGVIHQSNVEEAWYESSEPYYGKPHCPHCGGELKDGKEYKRCPHCYKGIDEMGECYSDVALSYYYEQDGYSAECGEDGDIFIVMSPYFTYAQFCSPCAPGACYLINPIEEHDPNNRCYCFGHDWFEDGKAPYQVWRVDTGEVSHPS